MECNGHSSQNCGCTVHTPVITGIHQFLRKLVTLVSSSFIENTWSLKFSLSWDESGPFSILSLRDPGSLGKFSSDISDGKSPGGTCRSIVGRSAYWEESTCKPNLVLRLSVVYRGYYTVARRYEFYVWVARTISHEWAKRTSEILFLPREHKIHIFQPMCNVLFIIWRNQFNKSKRRESWRHWTIRHSQRWHTENTPLGSRMKWRIESTSGFVPSKTLSSI